MLIVVSGWGPRGESGPQLLDDGAEPAGGVGDDDDVAVGEMMSATRLHGPVHRDVAGLDGDTRLGAVLHQTGQLEELAEPDASRH